jgi:hypothetical protein
MEVIATDQGSLLVDPDDIETKATLRGVVAVRKEAPGEGPSLPCLAERVAALEKGKRHGK